MPDERAAEKLATTSMELYFQDPQEPLRLFKELEEENLFLIQNAHENTIVRAVIAPSNYVTNLRMISKQPSSQASLSTWNFITELELEATHVSVTSIVVARQELETMERRFAESRADLGARLESLEAVIAELQQQLHEQREKCIQHRGKSLVMFTVLRLACAPAQVAKLLPV